MEDKIEKRMTCRQEEKQEKKYPNPSIHNSKKENKRLKKNSYHCVLKTTDLLSVGTRERNTKTRHLCS